MTQPVGPEWESPTSASAPAGLMAPILIQSDREKLAKLAEIAAHILENPLQVQQFTERVYLLMQEDLQQQRARQGRYGGRY